MYAFRILHDNYKKKKRESLVISEKIKKMKPRYFLFLRNNILKNTYDDLENEKKILFANEEEYENMKFKFDEIYHFRNYRKFLLFCFSAIFIKRLFGKLENNEINLNTNLIKESRRNLLNRIINQKYFKYLIGFAVIYSANKIENKKFEYDFANNIKINTRFGIYIWFENNLRLGKIDYITINYLDNYINNYSLLILNRNTGNFNKSLYDNIIFYQMMKIHFLEIFLAKTILNIYIPINYYKLSFKIDDRFLRRILEDYYKILNKERYFDIKNGIEKDQRLNKILINYMIPKEIRRIISDKENHKNDDFEINENSGENIITNEAMEILIENYQILFNLKDGLYNI